MKSHLLWALVCVAVGAAVYAGQVLATSPTPGIQTTFSKALFDEINVKAHALPPDKWKAMIKTHGRSDIYVVDNKIPAGGNTGWHSHPGPSLILVVAGSVTNYTGDDRKCTPHVYNQGDGFIDPGVGTVHILRNETGVQAETIAVQFLPKDATRKIDEPAPGNCPF